MQGSWFAPNEESPTFLWWIGLCPSDAATGIQGLMERSSSSWVLAPHPESCCIDAGKLSTCTSPSLYIYTMDVQLLPLFFIRVSHCMALFWTLFPQPWKGKHWTCSKPSSKGHHRTIAGACDAHKTLISIFPCYSIYHIYPPGKAHRPQAQKEMVSKKI